MPATINTAIAAQRLILAGVAAVTLLGLAACDPTTGSSTTAGSTPSAASSGASSGASSTITLPAAPATTSSSGNGSGNGGSAEPTNAPAAGGVPACADGQIKVTTTSLGFAMSHTGYLLLFTNTGGSTCSLTGYPGADLPDSTGQPWNATRTTSGYIGGSSTLQTVVLAPGKAASAILEWDDIPTDSGQPNSANCPGLNSVHLLITPPNTLNATTFSPLPDACQGFEIHPVVPGVTGRG